MSAPDPAPLAARLRAWSIHLFTASGMIWGLLALQAVFDGRLMHAYAWLALAVFIDCVDGPLARRFRVKQVVPQIDGALLDNIIDYFTWTFVPIFLIGWSGWLPDPWPLWASFPLLASLYAFTHTDAKQAEAGFFRGFPSYWNFGAFYVDVALRHLGEWAVAGILLAFSVLSVAPVRFVYPNRQRRMRGFFYWGLWAFALMFLGLIALYPDITRWLVVASAVYPTLYVVLSIWLDLDDRRRARREGRAAL